MISWWSSLSIIEQVLALIAIPATIILILQTVFLMFSSFGGDGDDFDTGHDGDISHETDPSGGGSDNEHDFEHESGLRIFTVRGFITFFCVFGWSGLMLMRSNVSPTFSISIGLLLGLAFMVLFAWIFAQFLKLQSNGAIDISATLGVGGTVYIPIPGKRNGIGKISATIAGRYSEYEAVTDEKDTIPTQTPVTVVAISNSNTLVVMRKKI